MARWSKSPNTVTGPKLWPYTHEEQHLPDDWQNSETVGKELMW